MKSPLLAATATVLALGSSGHIWAQHNLESLPENGAPVHNGESGFDRIRRVHGEHANQLFESVLHRKKVAPLQGGFAHLWLNRDLAAGNRLLREAHQAIIKHEGGTDVMTEAIAGSEHVKWQMRTWNRIYQLFNDKSRFHPGRLDSRTQAMIEELFWFYSCKMSRFERAAPQHVWGIHGSENHEMMHYSNALLALQAIKDRPAYRNRKLPDGRSPKEHYEAWNAYYKLYCVERAKHGLLIEVFSGYGKYTMPELFNLSDFAENPALRKKMEKLLHLIWADWAVGQINGVRGGGRLRLYQGDPARPDSAFGWGAGDMWLSMSRFLLDSGTWWNAGSYHPSPIIGYPLDPEDPRMLGYDHCTPDYVMGSLMIDPTLPQASSHDYLKGSDLPEGYPALTAQNRYYSIVFASDVNARVVPQCEGLANGKTYGEQQAVQHENVLLVQRHAKAKQTGDMRILFGGKGMKERLVERDGWLILREGTAWLGIKGFSRTEPNQSCGNKWDNEVFLRMDDGNAPVALIAGCGTEFGDIDAFETYLGTFSGTRKDGWFSLSGGKDAKVTLSLNLAAQALPKVNGEPIDLRPKMFRSKTAWHGLLVASGVLFGSLPASADHYLVYLIGGQSNANGRGDAAQLAEPLASAQKDVRFYWHRTQKTSNVGHLPENQWTDLAPGSGHGQTKPVYPKEFGPELSFGRALADAHPESKIAIIKYSHGGTCLHQHWSENGPIYREFVTATRAALSALARDGHTYELRGMIWQQGEADTNAEKGHAQAYQKNLTDLIFRVRKDLFEGKPAPFTIGGLSDSQDDSIRVPGEGWFIVRKAQEAVARTVPNVAFVSSDGLATRPGERIHFNHEGQLALGRAHAAAILSLEQRSPHVSPRPAPPEQ